MTVNVARRTRRRATPPATAPEAPSISPTYSMSDPEPTYRHVDSIAIGELDQTVFDCPNCRRPLALGARRCPGCRTRLVNGVVISKVTMFVAAGLVIGLVAGAAGAVALGSGRPNAVTPPVIPTASIAPAVTASATAPSAVPATQAPSLGDIPAVTRSALVQAIGTNKRLTASGAALQAALDAPTFDATDVAQTLRTMSADAVFGEQVASHVRDWSGTSDVGAKLGDFYGAVHETAATGLVASVRNAAAYRSAARTMLGLLAQIDELDAAMRAAALGAGVTLPD